MGYSNKESIMRLPRHVANNKDESRFLLRIPKITYRRTYIVNSKTAESANKYSQEQL